MNTPNYDRIAELHEQAAQISAEIAQEFRRGGASDSPADKPLRPSGLGTLQQAVFEVLLEADEDGFSPREIARELDRGDEPNIRQTLYRMRERGVANLLPGGGPQRWGVPSIYRNAR